MDQHEAVQPSPVEVTGTVKLAGAYVPVHENAADFGGYNTYVLTGSEAPRRILPRDPKRARAYITVTGTGPVWVGSETEMERISSGAPQNAGMVSGALVATGITLPVTHQQDVWLVGDGTHSATVTVAVERWA